MALKARAARTEARSKASISGDDKRLNITLSARDWRRLKKAAFKRDTTMKALVAEAVSLYLDGQPVDPEFAE
jgi:predicted DNA-binding ribbon-helix-helix protein